MLKLLFAFVGLLSFSTIYSQDIVKDNDRTKKLDLLIDHFTTRGFTGSVYIERGGEIILQKGYGFANKERKIPFQVNTAYSIGTLSQHFLASAIMLLHQRGQLDLQSPIGTYFKNVPKDKTKITVHHLLTHTSGLPDFFANKSDHYKIGKGEAVRNILREDIKFRAGSGFSVSNAGYTLLAAIVEEITNRSYLEFLQREFFDPLGMNSTGFHGERRWSDELIAKGYGFNERNNNIPMAWPRPSWMIMGNGEIISNGPDLVTWLDGLENGTILHRETVALMKEKHALDKTNRFIEYGYGLKKRTNDDEHLIYYNGGGEYGQICSMRLYPDHDMRMVIVSNTYTNINSIAAILIGQIEKHLITPAEKSD